MPSEQHGATLKSEFAITRIQTLLIISFTEAFVTMTLTVARPFEIIKGVFGLTTNSFGLASGELVSSSRTNERINGTSLLNHEKKN